jgi:hypothetical protein
MAPQLSHAGASVWNEANCSPRESVATGISAAAAPETRSMTAAPAELPLRFDACFGPPRPLPNAARFEPLLALPSLADPWAAFGPPAIVAAGLRSASVSPGSGWAGSAGEGGTILFASRNPGRKVTPSQRKM